jgi:hypothetical protein
MQSNSVLGDSFVKSCLREWRIMNRDEATLAVSGSNNQNIEMPAQK